MTETPASYPILLSTLNESSATWLADALARIEQYEAEGILLKVEFDWVKTVITNAFEGAWKQIVREGFTYNGKFQLLSDEERKLEQALFMPYPHVIAGYLKRAEAATKADGPMRDAMLGLLREIAPLAARLIALKKIIGKRPSKPTKAALAREGHEMTCQCCAHGILANTGVIAHHGYQRPGLGWQTASCPGAREVPFEVSRDWLGKHIEGQRQRLEGLRRHLARLQAAPADLTLTWTYSDRSQCKQWWNKGVEKMVLVTAATFDEKFEEAKSLGYTGVLTWAIHLEHAVENQQRDIKNTIDYITYQEGRYNGWKQTHERQGDVWVKLGEAA